MRGRGGGVEREVLEGGRFALSGIGYRRHEDAWGKGTGRGGREGGMFCTVSYTSYMRIYTRTHRRTHRTYKHTRPQDPSLDPASPGPSPEPPQLPLLLADCRAVTARLAHAFPAAAAAQLHWALALRRRAAAVGFDWAPAAVTAAATAEGEGGGEQQQRRPAVVVRLPPAGAGAGAGGKAVPAKAAAVVVTANTPGARRRQVVMCAGGWGGGGKEGHGVGDGIGGGGGAGRVSGVPHARVHCGICRRTATAPWHPRADPPPCRLDTPFRASTHTPAMVSCFLPVQTTHPPPVSPAAPQIVKLLLSALSRGARGVAGWLAACELLLEEGAEEAALDAAKEVRGVVVTCALNVPVKLCYQAHCSTEVWGGASQLLDSQVIGSNAPAAQLRFFLNLNFFVHQAWL